MVHPDAVTTRDEAVAFLNSRIDYERIANVPYRPEQFKLERMRELLRRLGDPHDRYPVVHIAGTKGKGSTAAMLAAALRAAGYRTGLYTSPHLERVEERLIVDGVPCSGQELVELVRAVVPAVRAIDAEVAAGRRARGPTYFEITTAMALLYFARRDVDVAVVEVGLGGRLDSTNVCRPVVCAITSISFDHTKQLGNTLASIAREKAGIIKPGVPVVSGVTADEPAGVIRQIAGEQRAPLRQLGIDFQFDYRVQSASGLPAEQPVLFGRLDYSEAADSVFSLRDVPLSLLGRHQAANAAVAVAVLRELQRQGWSISHDAILWGLSHAVCPARIQVVEQRPLVIIDTAHNVASVQSLVTTLNEQVRASRRRLLFATSRDKDARGMLGVLLPHFHRVVLTRFVSNPRCADPQQLLGTAAEVLDQLGVPADRRAHIEMVDRPDAAWQRAAADLEPDELLCVAGSAFFAGEILPLVRQWAAPRPAGQLVG